MSTNQAFAGMDFTGLGGKDHAMVNKERLEDFDYELPILLNRQAAVVWAHEIRGMKFIKRMIKIRTEELRNQVSAMGLDTQEKIRTAGQLMEQWDYLNVALSIILQEEYVGASTYAGSEPATKGRNYGFIQNNHR